MKIRMFYESPYSLDTMLMHFYGCRDNLRAFITNRQYKTYMQYYDMHLSNIHIKVTTYNNHSELGYEFE